LDFMTQKNPCAVL